MKTRAVPATDRDDGFKLDWTTLLGIAGAAAALGLWVNVVGGAVLWAQFQAVGLPADPRRRARPQLDAPHARHPRAGAAARDRRRGGRPPVHDLGASAARVGVAVPAEGRTGEAGVLGAIFSAGA